MPFFCRIGSATLVVLGVCTLVFLPIHLVPGDPGEAMLVAPHLVLALGLAILLVVLSVNLVGGRHARPVGCALGQELRHRGADERDSTAGLWYKPPRRVYFCRELPYNRRTEHCPWDR